VSWKPFDLDTLYPVVARCNRCQRTTSAASEVGTEDRMTQPDGGPCGGTLVAV
jgi:hypothetical protein